MRDDDINDGFSSYFLQREDKIGIIGGMIIIFQYWMIEWRKSDGNIPIFTILILY